MVNSGVSRPENVINTVAVIVRSCTMSVDALGFPLLVSPQLTNSLPVFLYRISYLDIFKVVELTCDKHQAEFVASPSLEEIIHYDLWAREFAASLQHSSGPSPVLA